MEAEDIDEGDEDENDNSGGAGKSEVMKMRMITQMIDIHFFFCRQLIFISIE